MDQWCMVERWYQCTPKSQSRHDIVLDPSQKDTTLHISAFCPERDLEGCHEEFLQCWTNLPISQQGDISEWRAINVESWQSCNDGQFATQEIKIDRNTLYRQLQIGADCNYGLTWRIIQKGKERESIRWLFDSEENATISFHIQEPLDISWKLARSLNIVENTVLEDAHDCLILSANLDKEGESTRLLSCNRRISSGATWERTKPTWHTSRSFTSFEEISDNFIASLIALKFGHVDRLVLILPTCGESINVKVIRKDNNLIAKHEGRRNFDAMKGAVFIAICPPNEMHAILSRCMQFIIPKTLQLFNQASPLLANENFGFCSWEALGAGRERPTLSKMIAILEKLDRRAPGALTSVLVDDGWQTIVDSEGSRRLAGFDMNAAMLDTSTITCNLDVKESPILKSYITELQHRFPLIRDYGVWMTLAGYWGGLDKESFSNRYGPLYKVDLKNPFNSDAIYTWHLPEISRLDDYYNDYFSLLKKSGITFIKVDDQAEWDWIHEITLDIQVAPINPIVYYDKAWLAMTNAAETHFGSSSVINCMAFGNRCITGQILPSLQQKHIFRNSDDTFPNVPESHIWHIYHNAMNVCLTNSVSNLVPDADMITTFMPSRDGQDQQDWADYHVAFRACFSKSILWISDGVNLNTKGSDKVLQKLLSHSKGKSVDSSLGRLKTVQVGNIDGFHSNLPLVKSVFGDLTSDTCGLALKMSCKWQLDKKSIRCAILSVWNVRLTAKSIDWITTADLVNALSIGTDQKESVFIFEYSSLSALLFSVPSRQLHSSLLNEQPLLPLALEPAQYRIYSIVSALTVKQSDTVQVACVGLVDKYAGLTAVLQSKNGQDKVVISSLLNRAGKCGFLLHGVTCTIVEGWNAYIDGSKVEKHHMNIEQINDCILCTIDMISHLQSSCNFEQNTLHWEVELQSEVSR